MPLEMPKWLFAFNAHMKAGSVIDEFHAQPIVVVVVFYLRATGAQTKGKKNRQKTNKKTQNKSVKQRKPSSVKTRRGHTITVQ